MAKTTFIYDFINTYNYKGREDNVRILINDFFRNNSEALADGLCVRIVFGNTLRERFYEAYRVDETIYKEFKRKHSGVIKNKAVDDLIYLALFTSYIDTKDFIFLDMLSAVEIGSKHKKFFKYGVTNPAKMKYVLENLSDKYDIKKTGSFFLMTQERVHKMPESSQLKQRFKEAKLDENYNYIISRISTTINQSMKPIANAYLTTKDDVIYTQSELGVSDQDKLSDIQNNAVTIENLKSIIYNYDASSLDFDILKTLRINSSIKKAIIKRLFSDGEKKYFSTISIMYLDYYTETSSTDLEDMKRDYIRKCMNARMKSKEMKEIEKSLSKDILEIVQEYKNEDQDIDGLNSMTNVIALVRNIKYYCIIKTRAFMNQLKA